MQLRKGDRVKILNEPMEGVVAEVVSKDEIYVTTADGFDFCYAISELIQVDPSGDEVAYEVDIKAISGKIQADFTERRGRKSNSRVRYGFTDYMNRQTNSGKGPDCCVEIDLHIEELVSQPDRLSSWEKITIQLEHCRDCMESAIELKVPHLVFIHGIGAGRLKQEIRQLLNAYQGVDVFDANFQRYGYGATQVHIMGLFAV